MRNAILTISVSSKWDGLGNTTLNTMVNYARRINADFININTQIASGLGCKEYEKFQLYDVLDVYDRVLLVDFDVIINKHCPDVFKIVPDGLLGVSTHHAIGDKIKHDIIKQFRDRSIIWGASKYWDSGVIVASKKHRNLFEYKTLPRLTDCSCAEERTFNYRIYKQNTSVFELGHVFHYQPGKESKDEVDPFIIHWAGGGRGGGLKVKAKAEQIKKDIANYSAWKQAGFPKQWR